MTVIKQQEQANMQSQQPNGQRPNGQNAGVKTPSLGQKSGSAVKKPHNTASKIKGRVS
jgi:hypothetical protein